jgi:DNA-directed RNA polymerase subunit RPC12/RpoP
MFRKNYVYIFDCVHCAKFYGEQTLTKTGELLCPSCGAEQWKESDYVEKMRVKGKVKPFDPFIAFSDWIE